MGTKAALRTTCLSWTFTLNAMVKKAIVAKFNRFDPWSNRVYDAI